MARPDTCEIDYFIGLQICKLGRLAGNKAVSASLDVNAEDPRDKMIRRYCGLLVRHTSAFWSGAAT